MRDVRVQFFGDSFTAGAGDPLGCGWVGRVAAAAMPITAYNLGIRGETSLQVLARFGDEAPRRIRAGARNAVVFSVGANDVCEATDVDPAAESGPRVEAGRSRATLAALLDGAAALGLPALVVGPLPVGELIPDARVPALDTAFAALCAERDIPYIAVGAEIAAFGPWRDESRAGDGAHPGRAGYDRLAELVLAGGFVAWVDRVAAGEG